MRLALVQPTLGSDLGRNLRRSLELMELAAERGADVVCFPELQLSPFFPQFEGQDASEFALTLEDEVIQKLRRKCAELNLIAFPNIYLREGECFFDASLAIGSDGSLLGISKMVHIVQAPCFFEQDYYTSSDSGFHVYDTPLGRIGVVICFDRHFPESFRTCVLKGAQLILVPTVNEETESLGRLPKSKGLVAALVRARRGGGLARVEYRRLRDLAGWHFQREQVGLRRRRDEGEVSRRPTAAVAPHRSDGDPGFGG